MIDEVNQIRRRKERYTHMYYVASITSRLINKSAEFLACAKKEIKHEILNA